MVLLRGEMVVVVFRPVVVVCRSVDWLAGCLWETLALKPPNRSLDKRARCLCDGFAGTSNSCVGGLLMSGSGVLGAVLERR